MQLLGDAFTSSRALPAGRLSAGARLPLDRVVSRQARIRWNSDYVGVTRHKTSKQWQAHVPDPQTGEPLSLGLFRTERLAAKAYDKALLFSAAGPAKTNFPQGLYAREDIEEAGRDLDDAWRPLLSSKYTGVYKTRGENSWRAEIEHRAARQFIDYYDNEEEAARAADNAVRSTFVERIFQLPKLNFKIDRDYFDEDTWMDERIPRGMSSRFLGVTFHAGASQFLAKLGRKHIDLFDSELDAAKAFDEASHAAGGLTNFRPPLE